MSYPRSVRPRSSLLLLLLPALLLGAANGAPRALAAAPPSFTLVAEDAGDPWAQSDSIAGLLESGVRGFGFSVDQTPPQKKCETTVVESCSTTPRTVCRWAQTGCYSVCSWWCSWWGCDCSTVCDWEQTCTTVEQVICEPVASLTCEYWYDDPDLTADLSTLVSFLQDHPTESVTAIVDVASNDVETFASSLESTGVTDAVSARFEILHLAELRHSGAELADAQTLSLDPCDLAGPVDAPLYVRATVAGKATVVDNEDAVWRRVQRCQAAADGELPTYLGMHDLGASSAQAVVDALNAAHVAPLAVPAELSHVGAAALSVLSVRHAGEQGSTWDLSLDSLLDADWLVQSPPADHWGAPMDDIAPATPCDASDALCDIDFQLRRCEDQTDCIYGGTCTPLAATVTVPGMLPQSLCLGHSDIILDDWYGTAVKAHDWLDITSLSAPNGRFLTALRNAITFLAHDGRNVQVRVLTGALPALDAKVDDTLESLLRDVPASHGLTVHVGAYRKGIDSWNHAKIVAADGRYVLQGGHNMWTVDYLSSEPIHDVSMTLTGSPATDAHRFTDRLWEYTCEDHKVRGWTSREVFPSHLEDCPPAFEDEGLAPGPMLGDVPVLTLGRLGALGANPADDALQAMLRSAEERIDLSLQDLGPVQVAGVKVASWPEDTLAELARAALRGVTVRLVLSQPGAVPGEANPYLANYGNGWTAQDVAERVMDHVEAHPEDVPAGVDPVEALCDYLHVTLIHTNDLEDAWSNGALIGNHTKLFVVDEQAFYLGSQNLYRADLAELGFVIDDADVTGDLMQQYFEPMWKHSVRAAVTGLEAPSCLF